MTKSGFLSKCADSFKPYTDLTLPAGVKALVGEQMFCDKLERIVILQKGDSDVAAIWSYKEPLHDGMVEQMLEILNIEAA